MSLLTLFLVLAGAFVFVAGFLVGHDRGVELDGKEDRGEADAVTAVYVLPITAEPTTAADPDIVHITVCEDDHGTGCPGCNRAMCGADLTDASWVDDAPLDRECIVCADLEDVWYGS